MGKKTLLNCLEKRELLNQPAATLESILSWGRCFEDAGAFYDAVDFYEKANAREELDRLLGKAIEDGNVFLILRLCRLLGKELDREEWFGVMKRAESLGKNKFAEQASRLAGISGEENPSARTKNAASS